MCADPRRLERDYLAKLRPERLDVSDAYGASGRRIFFLMWLKRMLKEAADGMGVKSSDRPVPIGCDNQGAIKLIASGVVRQKSKHIDVKYHHVHDEQMKGSVKFQYVTSESNPADLLTKPLAGPRHEHLTRLIGLTPLDSSHPEPRFAAPAPSHGDFDLNE